MRGRPGRDHSAPAGPAPDAGMVTAELAVGLPAVVLVLGAALGAIGTVTMQLRCADAAEVAARLAARGEPAVVVVAAARAAAPAGADIRIEPAGRTVTVVVSARPRLPGLGIALPAGTIRERFSEAYEPGVLSSR
jgi:hypothetical protein